MDHPHPLGTESTDAVVEPVPYGPYWSATLGPGALDPAGYQAAVRAALDAIESGEVRKVVVARDLVGTVPRTRTSAASSARSPPTIPTPGPSRSTG